MEEITKINQDEPDEYAQSESQAVSAEQKFAEPVNNPSDRSDGEPNEPTTYYTGEPYGAGADKIAGYTPTRHEVVQLAKYWYGELLQTDWSIFITDQSGNYDRSLCRVAESHIDRAEIEVGEKVVRRAINEVRDNFKTKVDARLWDVYYKHVGDRQKKKAVLDEIEREEREQDARNALKKLEQLEKEIPDDDSAMVLRACAGDELVLIPPKDSELNAVLQASGQFEIVTDRSRVRILMRGRYFESMGFLRATRRKGKLLFEFQRNPAEWLSLEGVIDQIKKPLHADTGIESQPV